MKPYVVGAIFARGGSKGLPRKNIRLLAGKPLIAYAIDVAQKARQIDRVIVSTDDSEIAEVARRYGAEVPFMRPLELACDDSPEWLAWQHAIRTLEATSGGPKIDVLACIPTTAPLRNKEDVEVSIQTLLDNDADVVITVTPAARSPYFNMVTIDGERCAHLVIQPPEGVYHRQTAPPVFDVTTVAFVARADYVLSSRWLYDGKTMATIVPSERALDIDTELDLQIAELLLRQASDRK